MSKKYIQPKQCKYVIYYTGDELSDELESFDELVREMKDANYYGNGFRAWIEFGDKKTTRVYLN